MKLVASFMSKNPGVTSGPAGIVHSFALSEHVICKGPLPDDDKAKLLIYLHDKWADSKVDRNLVVREINRKRYFIDGHKRPRAPHRVFKMLKKEHADSLCDRGYLCLGPLKYY